MRKGGQGRKEAKGFEQKGGSALTKQHYRSKERHSLSSVSVRSLFPVHPFAQPKTCANNTPGQQKDRRQGCHWGRKPAPDWDLLARGRKRRLRRAELVGRRERCVVPRHIGFFRQQIIITQVASNEKNSKIVDTQ